MLVDDEPYVIEFNVRLGDPEAQVLLPLINSSVLDMILYAIDGTIKDYKLKVDANYAVAVVLAAKGYPEDYKKGMIINGLDSEQKIKTASNLLLILAIFTPVTIFKRLIEYNYTKKTGTRLNVLF